MTFRQTLKISLVLVLVWKVVRTDWVVECQMVYLDSRPPASEEQYRGVYRPPVSPLWTPPSPQQIAGRPNAKWGDWEFFYQGGSGGPVSEPMLRVHWELLLLKALAGWPLLAAFLFAFRPLFRQRITSESHADPS